ncbi:hypothetical protein [Roseimaritima ulvae]|uniref:Uncharacterized protein n=1 Tax=Roseimaritima ulvae TaxID=980254 RepID=A0A5B9QNN7_9BACT|nr:hypothetical protein [Roseimaritima ulvae]QEG39559.1 hypothetical protein UC8_15540 [Roseimaritima ulvae]
MKRFLMIALAGAALTFFMPAKESKAADIYIGGGHGYGHGGGYYSRRSFGHHRGPYSGYHHSHHDFRLRVAPPYRGPYRSYRPYRGHRGLHLDVGPLHLGIGRHR